MNKIKRKASTFSRRNSVVASDSNAMASSGADERTALLNSGSGAAAHADDERHFWGEDDSSLWTRKTKKLIHLTWLVLTQSYVNVLLIFVPLGFIAGERHWGAVPVFSLNFIAIIPLASLLSFATEELSVRLGPTLGGLMNATFGNAVELIVSIIALKNNEIRIVQSSMLGSILSNILLVLGCCFLAAGIRGGEQTFNSTVASTMSSLMAVSSASLIIPATLYAALAGSGSDINDNILVLSHGTAIILLILYCLYLFFQLKTHAYLFDEEGNISSTVEQGLAGSSAAANGNGNGAHVQTEQDKEEEDVQLLEPIPAAILLLVVTVIISFCADYLVASIDDIVATGHISKTFIGLILIPIVGNAAEHATACIVAYKGKMDLAVNVALGSSLQIALFVTPFMVILGWIIGKPMTLQFQGFETVVFFLSVLVVNYLIQDGKSNYLEGCMCLGTYLIIALAFYVYPESATDINTMIRAFFGHAPAGN